MKTMASSSLDSVASEGDPRVMDPAVEEPTSSTLVSLSIKNFAHLQSVNLDFGDLTILVGPQGAGKSLALQWLKLGLDGRQIVEVLKQSGYTTDKPDILIEHIFGEGMATAWHTNTRVQFNGVNITPKSLEGVGDGIERLFFIPAHRALLITDGWAWPFQKVPRTTPAVARLFSQSLYDRFSNKDSGVLFPVEKRLKKEIRDQIDAAVFHGGTVGIQEDAQHAKRLQLVHGAMHLPFMTWTSGQREFTPLLLGLYDLLPRTKQRKHKTTDWIVIEEPEMGLHPKAITAVLLLVLELLWRGYRVVLSTHSPHVLTMVWMMQRLKEVQAYYRLVCKAFGADPGPMMEVAKAALSKTYRVHLLAFDESGKVSSTNISSLDPFDDDERVAEWGGLTQYSSAFAEAVSSAVNASDS
jgi:energy-coupling factor transporter ATP-binding protein EcfA2